LVQTVRRRKEDISRGLHWTRKETINLDEIARGGLGVERAAKDTSRGGKTLGKVRQITTRKGIS